MSGKEEAKKKIEQLIQKFDHLADYYKKSYNEEQTKKNFILPLFEILGWDITTDEVRAEESASGGRVDYAFKLEGVTKFYVEAKSIKANLEEGKYHDQLVEYAYNKDVNWGILTDFEDLKIFNALEETPSPISFSYKDYLKDFDILWLLSKESFQTGEIDKLAERLGLKTKPVPPIGDQLAKDLIEWRDGLTTYIKKWHTDRSEDQVNEDVQKFLDRLIFIRVAEDRGLEDSQLLPLVHDYQASRVADLSAGLTKIFREFDRKYDSNLFRKHSSEDLDLSGIADNITKIVKSMHTTKSGKRYNFSFIDADILGEVYQQYLGTVQSGKDKNLMRKKQGIYYTPRYIVDFIVENTLTPLIQEARSVKDLESIRVLDPAVGSGSFLIRAFDILENAYGKADVLEDKRKESILKNNLFGVDLDPQATEITQLNLLLASAKKRELLPMLDNNIRIGNSLIPEGEDKYNPFNFHKEFDEVLGQGGFDVIIGNPPYIKEYTNRSAFDGLHDSPYYQGKMDIWTLFACQAIDLLKDGGYLSFIAPNNWLTNAGASIFRDKILTEGQIVKFVDFGDFKVFKDAGIQTMIFIFKKGKPKRSYQTTYAKITDKNTGEDAVQTLLHSNLKAGDVGVVKFDATISPKSLSGKNIVFANQTNDEVLNKIEQKKNFELTAKEVANGIHPHYDFINKSIAQKHNNKFKVGEGIFGLSKEEKGILQLSKEEEKLVKPYFTTEQLGRYYANPHNNLWLIYTDSKFKNPKEMKPYPNLKAHLDKFRGVITSDNKPYGLHRARDERFFVGEKIIALRKCPGRPIFTYTDFDCYVSATFYVVKTDRLNQKYLTGLLNSKLVKYWFKHKGKMQGSNFQIDKEPLLNLPLSNPDKKIQEQLAQLVDKVTKLHQDFRNTPANTDKWHLLKTELEKLEHQIDQEIYKLYDLTSEEIKIVEQEQ